MKADRGIVEEVRDLAWTGHHAKAIATATAALETPRLDKPIALELLGLRSESHVAEGRLEPALADAKKMLAMAKASGRASHLAAAYTAMALAQMRGSEFAAASKSATAALKEADRAKDKGLQALSTMRLAEAKFRERRPDEALPLAKRAISLYEALGDKVGLGRAYWTLGSTLSQKGLAKECGEASMKALEIARACGDLYGVGNALNMLTFHEPDFALGLKWRNQARDAFKAAGYVERQAMITGNLSFAYARLGLLPRAVRFSRDAAEIYARTGTRAPRANILCFLAYRAAEAGHMEAAEELLKEARAAAKGIEDNPAVAGGLEDTAAGISHKRGDLRAAIKSYERALSMWTPGPSSHRSPRSPMPISRRASRARHLPRPARERGFIAASISRRRRAMDLRPTSGSRTAARCGRPATRRALPRPSRRPTA
jgi:tetratricopeptide (TPR) repeat protein